MVLAWAEGLACEAGMLVKAGQEPAKLLSLESEWAKVRRPNGWEEWLPREEVIPEDPGLAKELDRSLATQLTVKFHCHLFWSRE